MKSPNRTDIHNSGSAKRIGLPQLTVFSDDWGVHPSSSQHLVKHLMGDFEVLWVNTIGMRCPTLGREDLGKVVRKLRKWSSLRLGAVAGAAKLAANDHVPKQCNPMMYPGFRSTWQRKLNRTLIGRTIRKHRDHDRKQVYLTTLPVTADLVDVLPGDWVYYCVDDFSVWPGIDHAVMDAMERELVSKVDRVVCVSETLMDRMRSMGRDDAVLMTHGIDLEHWGLCEGTESAGKQGIDDGGADGRMVIRSRYDWARDVYGPLYLFWGLIDQRLDSEWVIKLGESAAREGGRVVLLGPEQSPSQSLFGKKGVMFGGSVRYADLPVTARVADVLVMPYRNEAVTRAMQPLKLKEYLTTGKPVVCRDLPATRAWWDGCDLACEVDDFIHLCEMRAASGIGQDQIASRRQLIDESWSEKARQMHKILIGTENMTMSGVAA
ncbi:hypothetical protein [Poriferisphaera sp. WC338]|uniref:hypothetical protein n=1 Tax=Poriferisphaera sp. WC338 TaxID=3425129 RepID=UPI003D81A2E5